MVKYFLVNFSDILYLKLYDFAEPISIITSGLYVRQILRKICFVQLN